MIKLSVGCDTVEDMLAWREQVSSPGEPWIMHTRQPPKRAGELIKGGSLYRVYKGFILSRQRILAIETANVGATRRCEVTLDHHVVRTAPAPRRAFQGWRYLEAGDAPPDLASAGAEETMPIALALRLREIGAW